MRPSGHSLEGFVFSIALVKSRAEALDCKREDSRAGFARLSLLTLRTTGRVRLRSGGFVGLSGFPLPHRLTLQLDPVGGMYKPVQNAVGNGRISDLRMPLRHRQLTRQQSRPGLIPLIADFKECPSFSVG